MDAAALEARLGFALLALSVLIAMGIRPLSTRMIHRMYEDYLILRHSQPDRIRWLGVFASAIGEASRCQKRE